MEIELLWYRGDEFFSRCIQLGQLVNWGLERLFRHRNGNWRNALYTHIAIKIGDNLYEALSPGITVHRGEAAEVRRKQAVATYSGTHNDPWAAIGFLEDQINDPYGFVEVIFVALDQLFPFLPVTLSAAADGTFICSALVAFALLILGVRLGDKRSPYLQTPASLAFAFNPSPLS